ncbi:MAG TPA: cytochrome c [Rhodanobacteraceae bacterium]|nr:cytochrome c [Rhodanobacteraceae bacterium]
MKRFVSSALLALALTIPALALAHGDPVAGKEKAVVCAACHGADGNAPDPQYPRLAGQWENYLLQALKEYKSGERSNPIMQGFVSTMSEDDMENLAAYFSSLPSKLDDLKHHIQGADGK